MPFPRPDRPYTPFEEYPYGECKGPNDWRVTILKRQVDEAHRVACEQYTRALKAEKAHVQLFDAHERLWKEMREVERERDELQEQKDITPSGNENYVSFNAYSILKAKRDELVEAFEVIREYIEKQPYDTSIFVYQSVKTALAKVDEG